MARKAPVKVPPEEVNHPDHYGGDTPYEHIKVMLAWGFDNDAFLYQVTKYLMRAGRKKGTTALKDFRKAAWYLQQRIEKAEREQ